MSDEMCSTVLEIMKQEPLPEMNDEYYELSESQQESLTYDEGISYYKNIKEYKQKQIVHKTNMIKHMLVCNQKGCKDTLSIWSNDEDAELVKKISKQQKVQKQ